MEERQEGQAELISWLNYSWTALSVGVVLLYTACCKRGKVRADHRSNFELCQMLSDVRSQIATTS